MLPVTRLIEAQLDGLPGPTHHYGGLAHGNLASEAHAGSTSSPRAAARQCLEKMRTVAGLGVPQFILPPLPRPDQVFLAACGFDGVAQADATSVRIACSSAFMWTANAATVIPVTDSGDGRLHLVPANLLATPHRALEGHGRCAQLRRLFSTMPDVVVHDPLPASSALADEGAANHSRLTAADGHAAVHVFVYGRGASGPEPKRYPARQTLLAQQAVARLAGLPTERSCFVQQDPAAIDAGAFHNDVVMVGMGHRLLIHQRAWCNQQQVLHELTERLPGLQVAEISDEDLTLAEAVQSYLFNSQLLQTDSGCVLLAPEDSATGRPRAVLDRLCVDGFIDAVHFVDLRQSMDGGGGPACLRLRLPLTAAQLAAMPTACRISPEGNDAVAAAIKSTWPETMDFTRLAQIAASAPLDDLLPGHSA